MDVDAVLAELDNIGATKAPAPLPKPLVVDEVQVERATPGVELRDLRGPKMVQQLDAAIGHLEAVVAIFKEMRGTWTTESFEVPKPVSVQDIVTPSQETDPVPASTGPKVVPTEEDLVRARELALKKIRGEVPGTQVQEDGYDEDNIPFVGQDRALPVQVEAGEQTVRTVGRLPGKRP